MKSKFKKKRTTLRKEYRVVIFEGRTPWEDESACIMRCFFNNRGKLVGYQPADLKSCDAYTLKILLSEYMKATRKNPYYMKNPRK